MIEIYDRPCGSGKTSALIKQLNDTNEKGPRQEPKKYLVIVPLLSEVSRILSACPGMVSPGMEQNDTNGSEGYSDNHVSTGKRKTLALLDLLLEGKSIVCTHALFTRLAEAGREGYLQDYDIIIDELPEVVRQSDICSVLSFKAVYLSNGYCTISEDGKITPTLKWDLIHGEVTDTLKGEAYRLAKSGCLYLVDDSFLLWAVPPTFLTEGKSMTVLTFLSKGSGLVSYLKKIRVPYRIDSDEAILRDFKIRMKSLLTVHSMPTIEDLPFSASGQDKTKRGAKVARALQRLRENGLKGVPHNGILVTSLKKNWANQKGEPGKFSKDSRLFESNWIPNTTRGTNDYRGCTHLVYLWDQYPNPYLKRWLNLSEDDARGYALSELIQWVYRSQIRDGKPVTLYLPSGRMRDILTEFII
jgi:hypothetical protein